MNLAQDLDRAGHRVCHKPAIVTDTCTVTFGELNERASRMAGALLALGVREGDRVGVILPSVPDHVVTFYAILKIGAVHVGVNLQLSDSEMARQLADADVACIVTDAAFATRCIAGAGALANLESIAVFGNEVASGATALEPLLREQTGIRPARELPSDSAAVIFYTSGTTGVPKGVVHTHEGLSVMIDAIGRRHRIGHEDSTICLLPLFMLSILMLGPGVAVRNGNTLHLLERYDPHRWARTVTEHGVTYALGTIPTLFIDLAALGADDRSAIDLSSLRFATFGGAPIPLELRREFEQCYGFSLTFGFGGTEGPGGVSSEPVDPRARKEGSVGFAYDHVELSIVDADDRPVGRGVAGEITTGPYLTGPFARLYRPMQRYWGLPEETADALRGGRLHWGDVGVVDEDGHLFVVDRMKDMIIRSGMNIYPAELERVICADVRIAQAAVVGCAAHAAREGQVPVAFVMLHDGAQASAAELLEAANARLSPYQRLDTLRVVDEFPRNSLGKILKGELAAEVGATRAESSPQSPT